MNEYFYGVDYAADRSHLLMVCSDHKLCYEVVPQELHDDDESYDPRGTADPEIEYADIDKLDWAILNEGGDKDEKGIPLSWYAIKNQSEAEVWYRRHTKMPEEMVSYAARYYWGEVKEQEQVLAERKKKRGKKKKGGKIHFNKGKFLVRFD